VFYVVITGLLFLCKLNAAFVFLMVRNFVDIVGFCFKEKEIILRRWKRTQ